MERVRRGGFRGYYFSFLLFFPISNCSHTWSSAVRMYNCTYRVITRFIVPFEWRAYLLFVYLTGFYQSHRWNRPSLKANHKAKLFAAPFHLLVISDQSFCFADNSCCKEIGSQNWLARMKSVRMCVFVSNPNM